MRAVPWPDPDPVVAAAIRGKYKGRRQPPLAVTVRDRLGQWMDDDLFAAAFGVRGRPGWPPSRLALVTVLQMAENLTDRQAAEAARTRLDWQYALGLALDDEGFDHSVLSEFRARVAAHGLEEAVLDALLARLAADGLVKAGGKQRTDSTHVIAQVRALHAVELAGEAVRAALEALAVACPDWLAARFCTGDWARRYGARTGSWTLPPGRADRDKLAIEYARDGYGLVSACYEDSAPVWARELTAVQVLRTVLIQNFLITQDPRGREVISRREPGLEAGVPPGHARIASPYDTEARWSVKKDLTWLGYKLHITETCDGPPACGCPPAPPGRCRHDTRPNLITHVATTSATVPDAVMTIPVSAALHRKHLAPARHYLDSGYASPQAMLDARAYGITLVTPLLADTSRQAREGNGYDRSAFTIDYHARTVTCPQGSASRAWTPTRSAGKDAIIIQFRASDCRPCPARQLCTTSARSGRQLQIPPRDLLELQATARASQNGKDWQDDYKRRAGIEAAISQAVTVTGCRHARYRGLARTRLQHIYSAVALNLCRLDAYWNDTPLHRTRTSHLASLDQTLRLAALPINHQHRLLRPMWVSAGQVRAESPLWVLE
jgi:transposase